MDTNFSQKRNVLTPELDALITALPKAELHIHLEGSIRPKTLLLLAQRNGIDLGCKDDDTLRALYSYRDFSHFIKLYGATGDSLFRGNFFGCYSSPA